MTVDPLDARIVTLFTDEPGISVLEASRRLGVARPTVQARLTKLHAIGAVRAIAPILDPAALGYPVTAICQAEIDQAVGYRTATEALGAIPEVLDMYTTSGDSDILLRIVARSNDDLQRVFDLIMVSGAVTRTRTQIVLRTHFHNKLLPLVAAAAAAG
jgi:Lrp/AsnC family transcriptional regulator for asnA, asnC and gidA